MCNMSVIGSIAFPCFSHPIGSMYAIYGNMDPINIPQMLAYIPAPWILWAWKSCGQTDQPGANYGCFPLEPQNPTSPGLGFSSRGLGVKRNTFVV